MKRKVLIDNLKEQTMWRAILVDDEEFVRAELAALFPWERYGFQLTGEADNARTALEMVRAAQPDLVITDIRMPEMDGLALIARLGEIQPGTLAAVVSAYHDFPYVREALRLGAVDYLIKAEATLETSGAFLERIGAILEQRRSIRRQEAELSVNLTRYHRLATESLWRDLLTRASDISEIETRARQLGVALERNLFGLILIHVPHYLERSQAAQTALQTELEARVRTFWDWERPWDLIDLKRGDFVIVACRAGDSAPTEGIATLQTLASRLAGGPYIASASTQLSNCADLPGNFQEVREVNLLRIYHPEASYFQAADLAKPRRASPPGVAELLAAWERVLTKEEPQAVSDFLAPIFQTVIPETLRPVEARWLVLDLINTLRRVALERQIRWEETDNRDADLPTLLEQAETVADWQNRLEQLAARVQPPVSGERFSHVSFTIRKALAFIQANYQRDLSLEEVAAHAGVSKSYLCRVFPEYTGAHFSAYLQRLRIERAKELLRFTNDHIYEIAAKVGFWNSRYFSRVFHDAVGMIPADYRRVAPHRAEPVRN